MPIVHFGGTSFEAPSGARLRDALIEAGLSPHNGPARQLNCRGFGTCGTCAVEIRGSVEPAQPSARERLRLGLPPHRVSAGLRLACQCRIAGDLEVVKHSGFWGERVKDDAPDRKDGARAHGSSGGA
jgi:ferredoxin